MAASSAMAGGVVSELCFGKRRARNSPDRREFPMYTAASKVLLCYMRGIFLTLCFGSIAVGCAADLLAAGAAGTSVQLRLDVSEEAAHESNWLMIQIDVGGGSGSSSSSNSTQLATVAAASELSSDAATTTSNTDGAPALKDLLAVIPAVVPKRVERELRTRLVEGYRELAVTQGQPAREARWGIQSAADEERTRREAEAAAEAKAAERARVTALLDRGGSGAEEELGDVGLCELAAAAAGKLAEEERAAAAQWAQRSAVTALAQLYRSRMVAAAPAAAPADDTAAESTAAEAAQVVELLLCPPGGASEELLLQYDLGAVVSIALSGLVAKEIAPYVSAARRAALMLGAMAMFVPAMFALLVAVATKSLLVESMREWDSAVV